MIEGVVFIDGKRLLVHPQLVIRVASGGAERPIIMSIAGLFIVVIVISDCIVIIE